jgi:hypothetical protein
VATIRKHELISLFLFFNEAVIFSSPAEARTHLLTAEIQGMKNQELARHCRFEASMSLPEGAGFKDYRILQ